MTPPAGTNKWRTVMLTVALIIGATATAAYARGVDRSLPPGIWGGEHLRLDVTSAGATLEFDCARGVINEPLRLDTRGRFSAKGTFTPERGGPTRRHGSPSSAARYSGVVKGDTITLTILLEPGKERVGVYELTRGNEPLLMKCR